MKYFLIILLAIFTTAPIRGGFFGNDVEHERRVEAQNRSNELEQQLRDQRERTEKWQIATGGLAIGCVVLLSIGTALGAKARRDENKS